MSRSKPSRLSLEATSVFAVDSTIWRIRLVQWKWRDKAFHWNAGRSGFSAGRQRHWHGMKHICNNIPECGESQRTSTNSWLLRLHVCVRNCAMDTVTAAGWLYTDSDSTGSSLTTAVPTGCVERPWSHPRGCVGTNNFSEGWNNSFAQLVGHSHTSI